MVGVVSGLKASQLGYSKIFTLILVVLAVVSVPVAMCSSRSAPSDRSEALGSISIGDSSSALKSLSDVVTGK